MAGTPKDEEREERIAKEVLVDAYIEEEAAMGWYYYLEGKIQFPFEAECISERAISPLRKSDKLTVEKMAPEQECLHEMYVVTQWEKRTLAVPLAQLMPHKKAAPETIEAVADWHYWLDQGNQF